MALVNGMDKLEMIKKDESIMKTLMKAGQRLFTDGKGKEQEGWGRLKTLAGKDCEELVESGA